MNAESTVNTSPSSDAVLRRLEWTVIRRLDGLLQGDYRTFFRGAGLDLADLRELLRAGAHMIRRRSLIFVVSDFISEPGWAEVLGYLVQRNEVIAVRLYDPLESELPDLGLLPFRDAETGETLLRAAIQLIPRRSMLFVVSDFISAPGWSEALARLALRHEVLAVRLYDAAELELPDMGLITIQDAETGEQMFVDTHDPAFRARFIAAAEAREAALHAALTHAGVDTLELATDDDLVDAVMRFSEMRRQRSRMAAGGGLPGHLAPLRSTPTRTARTGAAARQGG